MSKLIFEFNVEHKALGSIVSKISVYEERVEIERTISGVLRATVKLPTTTSVYFKDITGILHREPSFLSTGNMGYIEFSGIHRNTSTIGTVNVKGKIISNIEMTNAIQNPYCVVYSKDAKAVKENFKRLYEIFIKLKETNISTQNVQIVKNEESALDKIKKLKELLELGAITQAEFDEKKAVLMQKI